MHPDRFDLGQPGLLFWMLCRPWRKVPSPTRHHCEIRCLQESGHHRLNLRGFSAKASTVGQHQPAEAERRVVHAVVDACAVADVPLPLIGGEQGQARIEAGVMTS